MNEPPPKKESRDRTVLYIAIIGATATVLAALIGIVPVFLNRSAPPPTDTPPPAAISTNAPTTSTLVVMNQFNQVQDFLLDNAVLGAIETGKYRTFEIPPGPHEFKNCSVPSDPAIKPECNSKQVNVATDPYAWYIYGNPTPRENATLIVMNPNGVEQDVLIDDVPKGTVGAHAFLVVDTKPGNYVLKSCTRGNPPTCRPGEAIAIEGELAGYEISDLGQ